MLAPSKVMWLVPVRRGAAIDWAADTWLPALDEATAVRIVPPYETAACTVPDAPEKADPWAVSAPKRVPSSFAVHTTEAGARAHAAARGFGVSPELATRISKLYASGWALASFEIDGTSTVVSSPTLRVVDDGAPMLPFALTGSDGTDVKLDAFVIASGAATTSSMFDVDGKDLTWGPTGAHYAYWRTTRLGNWGYAWLREAAAKDALAGGYDANGTRVPSVMESYYPAGPCAETAWLVGKSPDVVGRACPEGRLAIVPGGTPCSPVQGALPPSTFVCGPGTDDLAIALAGVAPSSVVVTRFAGIVPKYGFGSDTTLLTIPTVDRSPVVQAGAYDCQKTPPPPSGSQPLVPPSDTTPGYDDYRYYRTDSCGGGTTVVVTSDEYEAPPDDEGCGGDTSTVASSSSGGSSSADGWDTDDDTDTGDGWDTDDDADVGDGWDTSDDDADCSGDSSSSSSSNDSCSSGGSKSSSSGDSCDSGSSDGWDDPDMAPKKTAGKTKKRRGSSPVSRYALFLAALLLPLRRRTRLPKLD